MDQAGGNDTVALGGMAKAAHPKKIPIIYIVGPIAALAGLLFGMDIGIISGALPLISKTFNASDTIQSSVVAAMMAGAALGAAGAGWLSHRFGRRTTLLISGLVFALGAVGCALAASAYMLIGMRAVLGMAVGISSYIAPIYLSEIAPEKSRGALISGYQLCIMLGILVAYLVDAALSYSGNWRWMLGSMAPPALLMVLAMLFLPRSPRWLMSKQREDEAMSTLLTLRQHDHDMARVEMVAIRESLAVEGSGLRLFLKNANFRRSTFLGMLLQVMQQLTGANVILYYAPRILGMVGITTGTERMWGTVAIGALMTLATFIAVGQVDRAGRKPLLYIGYSVMGACMLGMGILFKVGLGGSATAYIAIGLLVAFVISYAMSAAPVMWILCSEIQPLKGRNFGVSVSTVTNWVSNTFVGFTFLLLLDSVGTSQTFWMYAALNVLFIFLVYRFLPETKGVALEHIERKLMSGTRLRDIGV
ncbi:sugar porter family MFS transporter [Dyella sp. A6]|uniref:sugar porter family MFS transporter n=1 Tax=Dyella aluminiiresistens TaxID=3069105 RepID=UPI002E7824A0|nr:sugar porter family MFS transporter [Dyella sp. A6]